MPELQRLTADHADAVLAFEVANRDWFARSISDRGDAWFAGFAQAYAALLADQEAGGGAYHVLVEDGAVVGRVNLVLAGDVALLGYRVAEHVAGRGVATTAVREILAVAAALGVRTVRAAVSDANLASRRVLVKAGFTEVGRADPAEIGGKPGSWFERAQ